MDQVSEPKLVPSSVKTSVLRSKEVERFENIDFPELVKQLENQYAKHSLKIKLGKVQNDDGLTFHIEAMGLDQKPIKIEIEISSQITGFKMNTEHGERNSTTSKHCIPIISRKISHAVDRW